MIQQIYSALKRFGLWIRHWVWIKPVSKPEPLKLTEVIDNWIVIKYHDQNICLHKNEIPLWNSLGRKDRRAMALRFKIMEKKRQIRFEIINGKTIVIKNKDYGVKKNVQ